MAKAKETSASQTALPELIEKTRRELVKVTGLKAESPVGIFKDENGWHISVEMLEKKSIPDGMDVLATYEAIMNEEGELTGFNRKKMRRRMDVVNEEEV